MSAAATHDAIDDDPRDVVSAFSIRVRRRVRHRSSPSGATWPAWCEYSKGWLEACSTDRAIVRVAHN